MYAHTCAHVVVIYTIAIRILWVLEVLLSELFLSKFYFDPKVQSDHDSISLTLIGD
jgi:hypothetical protein